MTTARTHLSIGLLGLATLGVACDRKADPDAGAAPSASQPPTATPAATAASPASSTVFGETAPANACSPTLVRKVADAVAAYRTRADIPGLAVAVYRDGESCVLPFGMLGGGTERPVTAQTGFAMGSVQKVFNATLLASEIVQGHVSLDDPAATYLTAPPRTIAKSAPFAKVTFKQLATHTASLPQDTREGGSDKDGFHLYRDDPLPSTLVDFLGAWNPAYPPGTKYADSNLGFVLLGYATTVVAHKAYSQLLSDVVLKPLEMTRTGVTVCDAKAAYCATGYTGKGKPVVAEAVGLWTTATDMLQFLEGNLGVANLPDVQARAFALTHRPLFKISAERSIGMGWEISGIVGKQRLTKNGAGAGFSSYVAFEPKEMLGVAVLTNAFAASDDVHPATLGAAILDALEK